MPEPSAKKILEDMLHPVRMRILITLAGSEGMSPLQIAEALQDVPLATLYRHINRLLKAEILVVVGERPARGTLEKIYALNQAVTTLLGPDAFIHASKADHLRFFTAFAMTQVDQFAHYLERSEHIDLAADGVGYQQVALFMSDEELVDFSQKIGQAVLPYITSQKPGEDGEKTARKKRIFSTIMIPAEIPARHPE